jgi:hypothetical protein
MSKVKEISDMLIKIAYSDKKDRPSMIVDVKEMLNNIYTHEMPDFQFKLISEILDELEKESLTMVEVNDLTESKVTKKRNKKAKVSEAVEPMAEKIEVIEPETLVIDEELENKPESKEIITKKEEDDFSFLDDLDNVF